MATKQKKSPWRAELLKLRQAKPYRPFWVVTNSGEKYLVAKPLYYAANDTSMIIIPRPGSVYPIEFSDVKSLEIKQSNRR